VARWLYYRYDRLNCSSVGQFNGGSKGINQRGAECKAPLGGFLGSAVSDRNSAR
jgi:hypothetical protein